jgi:hypothetical protein
MRRPICYLTLTLTLASAACFADDDVVAAPPQQAVHTLPPMNFPIVPVISTAATDAHGAPAASGTPGPINVVSQAKWALAGYNSEEVIYTVVLTSHDPRIVRCVTRLSGFYYEDGKKLSVSDSQITTMFPEHVMEVGNWVGMDPESGATYTVTCHPV